MRAPEIDTTEWLILALDEEHDIPCELGPVADGCDNKAEWIMFRAPHACHCKSRPPGLACTRCKDYRMSQEGAVVCRDCGQHIAPARMAYSRVESL